MKVVNLSDFRALPGGTVFAKYEPCNFRDLCVKGETWEHDFCFVSLTEPNFAGEHSSEDRFRIADELEHGGAVGLDFTSYGRDGYFDADQLFAVWDRADVESLIAKLQASILEATP